MFASYIRLEYFDSNILQHWYNVTVLKFSIDFGYAIQNINKFSRNSTKIDNFSNSKNSNEIKIS